MAVCLAVCNRGAPARLVAGRAGRGRKRVVQAAKMDDLLEVP